MIAVSNDFKAAMKEPVKEIRAYIDAGYFVIRDGEDTSGNNDQTVYGDLISFKVSCESGLCKSAMRKLEAKYLGEHNLVGKWVTAGFGVKLASGTFEYLNYGSFYVSEQTVTKDTGVTDIVAYDKMYSAMIPYSKLDVQYPITLFDYAEILCNACGLVCHNCQLNNKFANADLLITGDLWENINGITYRDIFVQIAQATGTTCIISDDEVYFKRIIDTRETLTYDNMLKLKIEPTYGPITSIVLARTPQEDNVYTIDDQGVDNYGLTEFRIENNEIVDKDREGAISGIADALMGTLYSPFETTTEGLGWFEIGDGFYIKNETENFGYTALFNYSITIDGSIKETLKTAVESQAQTQYQYAKSLASRIKNTEIVVDKQKQKIELLVSDMDEVAENYTKIEQDIKNITQSVQTSGGNNIIRNSVMFAYDSNGQPSEWTVTKGGDGTLTMQGDPASILGGCVSGHSFTLRGATCKQDIKLKPHTDSDPSVYTLSVRINKGVAGNCIVRLLGKGGSIFGEINIPDGTAAEYEEFVIKDIRPPDGLCTIMVGVLVGEATFTDLMLVAGDHKAQWTQANGEVMNTQVNVNIDGITVKSSIYQGDYTVMSPLEFAGYSYVGGTLTRVFSLNKATTTVKELEAEDEIKMTPIKIVPITTGDIQGWAFVPTT